jgi:pyruvate dehydrogenase E1 component alpha subunit
VRAVVEQALERARAGQGPTLVEAVSYRLCDHTTADDASRYRDDAEVSKHWPAEPIARLRHYLMRLEIWDKDKEEKLLQECGRAVETAAEDYLATAPLPGMAMFEHVYREVPTDLADQRQAAVSRRPGAA